MKTLIVLILYFISYVPVLAICAATPYITRKTESFGISIPEEAYSAPEVKLIRDIYRNNVLIFGGVLALSVLILALFAPSAAAVIFIPVGTVMQLLIMFVFYFIGHKSMKTLKANKNWVSSKPQMVVIDTGFRLKKVLVSPLWFMSYVVVIAATLCLGFLLYDKMPEKIPMHWNINGEIDRWVTKSYKVIFFAPVMQIFVTLLMGFVYWSIGKAKQQIDASNPEKSMEQNRLFRYSWSTFTVFAGLATLLVFSLIQFSISGLITNPWLIILFPIIIEGIVVVAAIILSFKTGQGGSRITVIPGKSGEVINRDDDKYWKLGMFYYNPDDPALFVEKRFGLGWTNNFARPMSWSLLVGLIIFIVLMSRLSIYFGS